MRGLARSLSPSLPLSRAQRVPSLPAGEGRPLRCLGPDTAPRHSPMTQPREKMPGFVAMVQGTRNLCIGIQLMAPDAPIIFTEQ